MALDYRTGRGLTKVVCISIYFLIAWAAAKICCLDLFVVVVIVVVVQFTLAGRRKNEQVNRCINQNCD